MLSSVMMSLMFSILHACLHMIHGGVRAIRDIDGYFDILLMYYQDGDVLLCYDVDDLIWNIYILLLHIVYFYMCLLL